MKETKPDTGVPYYVNPQAYRKRFRGLLNDEPVDEVSEHRGRAGPVRNKGKLGVKGVVHTGCCG